MALAAKKPPVGGGGSPQAYTGICYGPASGIKTGSLEPWIVPQLGNHVTVVGSQSHGSFVSGSPGGVSAPHESPSRFDTDALQSASVATSPAHRGDSLADGSQVSGDGGDNNNKRVERVEGRADEATAFICLINMSIHR